MNTRSLWTNKWTRRLFIAAALAAVTVVAACVFFRVWSPGDIQAYIEMPRECHPVWREFALRRLGTGDSVVELLRRFPPTFREEFGRYDVYRYYRGNGPGISLTGLEVVARDGRLLRARAASCTWRFTFFDALDPALDTQYAAFAKERSEGLRP